MIDYSGHVVMTTHSLRGHVNHLVINLLSSLTTDQADVTDDDNFYQVLASHVQISSIETSLNGNGHIPSCKTVPIEPQTLAARWKISPKHANCTVIMTMQRKVRTCLNSTLSWQFLTNDQMLRHKRVLHPMFSDNLLLGPCHNKAPKWPRLMLRLLVGHVLTPWSAKGTPMRPCPSSSSVMVYLQPWSLMTPRNRPNGSFDTSSRRLTATHE